MLLVSVVGEWWYVVVVSGFDTDSNVDGDDNDSGDGYESLMAVILKMPVIMDYDITDIKN